MNIHINNIDPGVGGVDLNRNFGFQHGQGLVTKDEQNSHESTYTGPKAFSEPETQVMRDFMTSKKKEL